MGVVAERMVAYAEPLLEGATNEEEIQKAFDLAGVCFSLSVLLPDSRAAMIKSMQATLGMSDEEFCEFANGVIYPMIARHKVMFPRMHGLDESDEPFRIEDFDSQVKEEVAPVQVEPRPYDPCSCGSGLKYKFCCRKKAKAK